MYGGSKRKIHSCLNIVHSYAPIHWRGNHWIFEFFMFKHNNVEKVLRRKSFVGICIVSWAWCRNKWEVIYDKWIHSVWMYSSANILCWHNNFMGHQILFCSATSSKQGHTMFSFPLFKWIGPISRWFIVMVQLILFIYQSTKIQIASNKLFHI